MCFVGSGMWPPLWCSDVTSVFPLFEVVSSVSGYSELRRGNEVRKASG